MNAPHPLQTQLLPSQQAPVAEEADGINLVEYWDIVCDNRWLVSVTVAVALALGGSYAFFAAPVYEATTLLQVEDTSDNVKDVLGQAASLFDTKSPTSAELEILHSRLVIGKAVDSARLYIDAHPRYIPLIGAGMASRAQGLSDPGFLGFSGYVHGREAISVPSFNVPAKLEGSEFTLRADGGGRYTLTNPDLEHAVQGTVDTPLVMPTRFGNIELLVSQLQGKPGAEFSLTRISRLTAISNLQKVLKLQEKGRQSGVMEAALQGPDPQQLTMILNAIGQQYVRQNIERKSAEAEKTLAFLDVQMPQFKSQLRQTEEAYTRYRDQKGTIALDQEAQLILQQVVDLESKLLDAKQRRLDLVARFTSQHPAVRTLDEQIAAWQDQLARLKARIKAMPDVQQDATRLQRDVQVNDNLYQQLRNSALQLQLVREGKIGNVRVIDEAAKPELPVGPYRILITLGSAILGAIGGVMLALARNALFRGVRNAQEIEAQTSLNVYSTIPLSAGQDALARKAGDKEPGLHLLAAALPDDPAIESMRSLRTALQFAMLDASNNRIIITGATPGVGKSFVSANFAALLASTGKRVLLIDADMRKGHLNQYFGIPRARGLSELIVGGISLPESIRSNLLPNLDFISTGVLPPNPAEILMSASLTAILDQVSAQYDLVIIDTPPVLVAADTPAIASTAGTLLLVARAEDTQMGELHECAKRLTHAGKSVTGVLLNALDLSRRHYGSYAYKYGGYRYRQYTYTQGS